MTKLKPFGVLLWNIGRLLFYYNEIMKGVKNMIYPYSQQGYQPYPSGLQNSPQRAENTLIRVTGLEGAKAYQMYPNSTVALFDGGEDLLYIKSTDGAGFPTIRTFRFEPVESCNQEQCDYVTRAEFEELRKELNNYGKFNISGNKPKSSGNKTTNGND